MYLSGISTALESCPVLKRYMGKLSRCSARGARGSAGVQSDAGIRRRVYSTTDESDAGAAGRERCYAESVKATARPTTTPATLVSGVSFRGFTSTTLEQPKPYNPETLNAQPKSQT
eukprot:6162112-Pyramimonas_sp.AAC.1